MATNFPDTTVNNPDTGRLWADGDSYPDPETGLIYYWYSPVWKTAISPTGTTDAKYVEVLGDNMMGDLTLGPDGGPEVIKLDENNGEILVKNSGETTARLYNEGTLVLGKGTTTAGLQYSVGGTAGNGFLKVYGNSSTTDTSTALMIDSDRDASDPAFRVSYGGDVQMASQNGGPLAGFRNLLINGDFRVWQRSNENVALAGTKYAADRWVFSSSATVNRTNQTVGNFPNAIRIQGGFNAGYLRQAVELPQAGQLGVFGGTGTTFTVSIYASTVPDIRVLFVDDNIALANSTIWVNQTAMTATGNSVSGTPTGTLNRYSITISNPPVLAGTNQCCVFEFRNAEYYTGAQLEPGPVATPFEHRPIGTELALCQRYFCALSLNYLITVAGDNEAKNWYSSSMNLPATMRAIPTSALIGTISPINYELKAETPSADNYGSPSQQLTPGSIGGYRATIDSTAIAIYTDVSGSGNNNNGTFQTVNLNGQQIGFDAEL